MDTRGNSRITDDSPSHRPVGGSSSTENLELGDVFQNWSSAAVVLFDSSKHITAINQSAERLTGLKASQVVTQSAEVLPQALSSLVLETFSTGQGVPDRQLNVGRTAREGRLLRASS